MESKVTTQPPFFCYKKDKQRLVIKYEKRNEREKVWKVNRYTRGREKQTGKLSLEMPVRLWK